MSMPEPKRKQQAQPVPRAEDALRDPRGSSMDMGPSNQTEEELSVQASAGASSFEPAASEAGVSVVDITGDVGELSEKPMMPGRIRCTPNRMGHAEVESFFGNSVYMQVDTDVEALRDDMNDWERSQFDAGWPVVLDDPGYFLEQDPVVRGDYEVLGGPVSMPDGTEVANLVDGTAFAKVAKGEDLDLAILRRKTVEGVTVLKEGEDPGAYLANWVGAMREPKASEVVFRLADIHGGSTPFSAVGSTNQVARDLSSSTRPSGSPDDTFELETVYSRETPGKMRYSLSGAPKQVFNLVGDENRWRGLLAQDSSFAVALTISDLLARRGREKAVGLTEKIAGTTRVTFGEVPLAGGERRRLLLVEGMFPSETLQAKVPYRYSDMMVIRAGEVADHHDAASWAKERAAAVTAELVGRQELMLSGKESGLLRAVNGDFLWDAGLDAPVHVNARQQALWAEAAQDVNRASELFF